MDESIAVREWILERALVELRQRSSSGERAHEKGDSKRACWRLAGQSFSRRPHVEIEVVLSETSIVSVDVP